MLAEAYSEFVVSLVEMENLLVVPLVVMAYQLEVLLVVPISPLDEAFQYVEQYYFA